jgi:UPF0755 protein
LVTALLLVGFFYFRYQIYFAKGMAGTERILKIAKGESGTEIAEKLEKENLISGKMFFLYYLKKEKLGDKILPGEYELNSNLTIPEITILLTQKKEDFVRLTFPEGWDSQKIAERLTANSLDGQGFLALVKKPEQFKAQYAFLQDPTIKSLEGFLFPDTYFFKKEISPEEIVLKMLDNFDTKLTAEARTAIQKKNSSIFKAIILASIVEKEVRSDADRAIAAGIFWERIAIGQPLQSCATLAYILGENKKQYTYADTQIKSPYNTYQNKGLPPGPISNPGLSAIKATIYPVESKYNYFLSDPATDRTIFSQTFEEHLNNKAKYGL